MTATIAGIHLGIDTHANRPAGNSCPDSSFYSCSTHGLIYKSNYGGNSWATWATLGGAAVTDATIAVTDVTTNNASTSAHGWLKKLSNVSTEYMSGTGVWSTPAGGSALASASYKRSAGDYTTSSSTFGNVDGTNFSLTITTGARRVLIVFTGTGGNNGGDYIELDVTVDGTRQGGAVGIVVVGPTSSNYNNISFSYLTDVLSAASHTFNLQYKTNGSGTASIFGSSPMSKFAVMEQGG
jgi:hypothetical protein